MPGSVISCVGAIVTDAQGRLLMIKRGHEPGAGLWSIPGGRIEPGETDAEALVREMLEETSLTVEPGRLLGRVQRPGLGGAVIDIRDYAATVVDGTLRAGDDAADVRWVATAELDTLEITEGLLEALTDWGILAAPEARAGSTRPEGERDPPRADERGAARRQAPARSGSWAGTGDG